MKAKDMTRAETEWIKELEQGNTYIMNKVLKSFLSSENIVDAKEVIISEMSKIMTECALVIQNVDAMEDD